jgi:hypothetical protein
MLSPNASNLAAPSAKPVSVTVKEHVAWRVCASFAAHATVVVPSGKAAPDSGVHVTVTGVAPPVTCGGS